MTTLHGYPDIQTQFPALDGNNHKVTSPPDYDYNCIAWAAEDDQRFWWPSPQGITYWPPGLQRNETKEAFFEAFGQLGYSTCDNGEIEAGFQKVCLYTAAGKPTHMARQLADGTWTSKLGSHCDIMHTTTCAVFGPAYGDQVWFMKRKIP